MFINLQSNAKVTSIKVYLLKQADKNLINQQFDELQRQNKLKFITQFIFFNYSIFVI